MATEDVGPYSRMTPATRRAYLAAHPFCQICGSTAAEIDHHHPTDTVRGALCHRCNCEVAAIEGALQLPQRKYQSIAGDLHRALASKSLHLRRWHTHLKYLGMTAAAYRTSLQAIHDQLTQRYVYWTPLSTDGLTNNTEWIKTGPLLDDTEARRVADNLLTRPRPPYLWIYTTWEADDGHNSPFPRHLVIRASSSPGMFRARSALLQAQQPDDQH